VRGLQISEDMRFQERQWRVSRATVGALLALTIVGVAGVTGSGPLSDAEAGGAGGALEVRYERFLRLGGPVELEVRPEAGRGTTEIVLDDAYLEGFDLEAVTPQPDSEFADRRGVVLEFEDGPPATAMLSLTAREIGLQRAVVSVSGIGSVSFRQFVYP
jgi:hypothetical protein